jgi:hypothetical protein
MSDQWKPHRSPSPLVRELVRKEMKRVDPLVFSPLQREISKLTGEQTFPDRWKPHRHQYPDPLGDLFRQVKPPQMDRTHVPLGPTRIEPLPGQIRRGGKLYDQFDPDFPPVRVRRSRPRPVPRPEPIRTPFYELKPGEAFAQTGSGPGSLRWMARRLG